VATSQAEMSAAKRREGGPACVHGNNPQNWFIIIVEIEKRFRTTSLFHRNTRVLL
jgi:hypothetical protein